MAVVSYATNSEVCRSRQLLRYFDEEKTTDCGHCDVCAARMKTAVKESRSRNKQGRPYSHSSPTGSPMPLPRFFRSASPRDVLGETLECLISEEAVYAEDGNVMLA